MAKEYDVVILGGGPGGYVAAIRAAQLGLSTALVEAQKLGGTCLHKGCIPSKALLRSAEVYATLKEDGESLGITAQDVGYDFQKVNERKQKIVDQLHQGVQYLMKKNKIDVYHGYGRILGPSIFSPTAGTISVEKTTGEENEMLVPKNLIIATGSRPRTLPGLEIDGTHVLTSDEALELEALPQSMIIVGGGVIGIEWASLLSDFGVEVTVLEYAERILPQEDEEISKEMARLLKRRKVRVVTGAEVLPQTLTINGDQVTITAKRGDKEEIFTAEKMLVSVGRVPNTEGIGLENTDIKLEKGFIKVNEYGQTAEAHIYAIGDVTGGLQLAHVASHEGIVAVEHIAGLDPAPVNPHHVPRCTYSRPEVASIGLTEAEARSQGYEVKTGKFSFKGVGKALILGDTSGFVKVVMDAKSQDLLGVHMIGPHVTDLISEAGLAKVLDATPWEISQTIHPHPTLSEAIGEAAMAVEGLEIHA
ncbi:dihydrolipoamide dehydrogenase [Caldalkalibacillus thermarum TA2.A1]|uniref:Dihydrolipoyl dehydrogenase n=1 Tax=Caldalkalibacillus thermarum (strain TA2.A1) TaxID=986075 RepID=F5L5H8_CALTT|nr:dihydrolipoyl dehydrogenase [Caldalkalibacillus thermarum]EGL83412.1 dihydrolipoamide dehydrogenase [Caldalkalibacillus thermarum TA2.A1]QZT32672.1 dihydrolipoyl dehydrogenase [Caldalkalibacillus thermarum TA2.A1]